MGLEICLLKKSLRSFLVRFLASRNEFLSSALQGSGGINLRPWGHELMNHVISLRTITTPLIVSAVWFPLHSKSMTDYSKKQETERISNNYLIYGQFDEKVLAGDFADKGAASILYLTPDTPTDQAWVTRTLLLSYFCVMKVDMVVFQVGLRSWRKSTRRHCMSHLIPMHLNINLTIAF